MVSLYELHKETTFVFLVIITIVLFIILGLTIPHAYLKSQTSNMQIVELGTDYLEICMIFCFGLFLAITFERLLQSTGRTVLSMISQLAGAITNIILDPVMIFGLLGFPAMGIKGAAWATVIGQITGALISIILNIKINKEINFNPKGFKPQSKIIIDIYKVGIPSILLGSIGSVLTYLLNLILGAFSTVAIAVYGVYFKLQSFVFMPVFGMNNGLVPIIAYNYGAKQKKRIMTAMKLGMLYAFCMLMLGFVAFQLCPGFLLQLFNASESMLSIGIPALRLISISFIFAAFSIISISMLQSLGHGIYSMFISVGRQLVVLVPAAYLLSKTGNLDLVWLAFPLAEIMSIVLSGIFLRKVLKTLNF